MFHRVWAPRLVSCVFLGKEFFCACGCHGRHTFDAILEVLVYTLNALANNLWPDKRHDLSEFDNVNNRGISVHKSRPISEKTRVQKIGEKFGFCALLQQCRGDWMWYKELLSFPSWAANWICWLCEATKENYKDFGSKALWRAKRLTPAAFFAKMRAQGISPSPLFNAIGFTLAMVVIDVLHCMDLGCSQDILGNIMWEAMPIVCKGRSHKAQVSDLWERISKYNQEFKPSTVLQGLTLEMIKRQKKSPKLKAKGAETRHLVPFGVLLASEMHEVLKSTHSGSVLKVATLLFDLYCLFSERPPNQSAIGDTCRRLCLLYKSLGSNDPDDTQGPWRLKPKFHMMCELCEHQVSEHGSPEEFWAYADESFVGFVAEFSHKRGGAATASTSSENCLNRFKALSNQA